MRFPHSSISRMLILLELRFNMDVRILRWISNIVTSNQISFKYQKKFYSSAKACPEPRLVKNLAFEVLYWLASWSFRWMMISARRLSQAWLGSLLSATGLSLP